MITICTIDVNPTLLYDEEGYDVIQLQVVNVLLVGDEIPLTPKQHIENSLENHVRYVRVESEISTFELSFDHETQGKNSYDASNEVGELEPIG